MQETALRRFGSYGCLYGVRQALNLLPGVDPSALRITVHKLVQRPVSDRDTLEGLTQFLFDDVAFHSLSDWPGERWQIGYA